MLNLEEMMERRKLRRKVSGTVAVLVPYESDGRVAAEAFERLVGDVHRAGLVNAVNMDTGYVNYLSDPEKRDILRWTREALGGHVPFVAGAHIEGREGDVVALYRQQMDLIASFGGTPVLFQTARLHGKPAKEKVAVYRAVCRGYDHVIAFEMGTMFAPNGEIFDEETVRGLMEISELKGLKHASLDRLEELKRLALRDALRPEFRIYTGNDLGINMIEYGSDYLLGLASFAPEKFAERDRLWETGDPRYYALSDALQYLGNVAFRAPVPAYRHSAAVFLHLLGRIPTDCAHPQSPQRPAWEAEILRDCARRLGYNRFTAH
ncbi:MAG: dihydrodipicolinate synthase family protein [Acidobacteriia bacterium]|nr:dihydrodipicolinate synthase family protein [Terriglobia bacterium]